MTPDEVERLLQIWKVPVVPEGTARVRGYDLETYRELAKQTECLDYDCAFGGDFCRYAEIGERGCCAECGATFGHWRKEAGALDAATLKVMAEQYDPEDGFWRTGIGCLLPRALRSPTCLYTICSDQKLSNEDKELLNRIRCGPETPGKRGFLE